MTREGWETTVLAKVNLQEVQFCGIDRSVSGQGIVAGSYEDGNEYCSSIKDKKNP